MRQEWQHGLGLQHAVVQAGLGGGLSGAELASAVSLAGGLGTVGLMPPSRFETALEQTRTSLGNRPFAANLLLPFVTPAHLQACLRQRPPVVSLFFGFDRQAVQQLRAAGCFVMHQVGTAAQAQRALHDGAQALIVQGAEAGGHLWGHEPLAIVLPKIRQRYPDAVLIAAGGIYDGPSAAAAMALGADGVAAGTRFLMTPESNAHPAYLERLLHAQGTLRTKLFGLAWPDDHRVVPNAATSLWCRKRAEGPRWVTVLNTLSIPTRKLVPASAVTALMRLQSVKVPVFSPAALTRDMDVRQIETTPLYAGECVTQIRSLKPAGEVVAEIASGLRPSASTTNRVSAEDATYA